MNQPAARLRIDPARSRVARLRARIVAARAARQLSGISSSGRVAGRLGAGLEPLDPAMDCGNPHLSLIPEPELAARVFEAAAAALMADEIARAIRPEQIAALPVSGEARDFALRHRSLSLDRPTSEFEQIVQELVSIWARELPAPLDREYAPSAATPEQPEAEETLPQLTLSGGQNRNGSVTLPLANAPARSRRHAAALTAAMAAITSSEEASP
ncbi:hypothetical protein [Paracoccus alkanivorans]|uniref:Uncharacterized protein n=1 Tax=Paracoccus alkanivorans TaxID=2116655 RepID=A0A3M0MH16_9RHOB|nr:hypothetical protein [Paracoccus alkanivorans]RMC34940.1 hypothetical protein C9E81_12690 [Paracoccus alkanivorans]